MNLMRGHIRDLSDAEKAAVQRLENLGEEFVRACESNVPDGRESAIAKTKMEEAVMWAVKGVTAER